MRVLLFWWSRGAFLYVETQHIVFSGFADMQCSQVHMNTQVAFGWVGQNNLVMLGRSETWHLQGSVAFASSAVEPEFDFHRHTPAIAFT
jgi:hypothetical protein